MNYIYFFYSNKGRKYKKKQQVSMLFAMVFYLMFMFGNKKKGACVARAPFPRCFDGGIISSQSSLSGRRP